MSRYPPLSIALLLGGVLLSTGCGGDDRGIRPLADADGKDEASLTYPALASKNTTRVSGANPTEDAAFAALVAYPAVTDSSRPRTVALVHDDWRTAVAASVLVHAPIDAALLLSSREEIPTESASALDRLAPTGLRPSEQTTRPSAEPKRPKQQKTTSKPRSTTQTSTTKKKKVDKKNGRGSGQNQATGKPAATVIRVGAVPNPEGHETDSIGGADPAQLAANIDLYVSRAAGKNSRSVVVVSDKSPSWALPAASWAAKSGDPVLFVGKNRIPKATSEALKRHKKPRIFLLGSRKVISTKTARRLQKLGTVGRISAATAVANAVAFARYRSLGFGWGVVDPGHGLVFINDKRPLDVLAAAQLAASGKYGPLLLVSGQKTLPKALRDYLLDIQPGYRLDPVRGIYNHGWLIGDAKAIDVAGQEEIDRLLEIKKIEEPDPGPSNAGGVGQSTPPSNTTGQTTKTTPTTTIPTITAP